MRAAAHRDSLQGKVQFAFKVRNGKRRQFIANDNVVILVTSDVIVCESLVELLEVSVVDVLKYQGWRPAHRVLAFWHQFLGRNLQKMHILADEEVCFRIEFNVIP